MKNLFIPILVVVISLLISCSSGKEEPKVDCSESDIALSLADTLRPDCTKAGSITVNATGGGGEYLYKINGAKEQPSATFSDLGAGFYQLSVTDNNGCTATLDVTLEAVPGSVTAVADQTMDAGCEGSSGEIMVTASGGDGVYKYSLDGGTAVDTTEFGSLSAGEHTMKVTDGEGCSTTIDVYVRTGVSLADDIMPLVNANCATSTDCHKSGQSERPVFENNPSAVIENSANVKEFTQSGYMPFDDTTLSQEQIDLIACWVDDGALDN
ncbi:SprB repeat-containing protein [Marinoscillum sp. MHG1-6]|uniref:SprB repeat-containing protein n=1 Tax=Marinoscillum sp. MHG1-6 TaxID=2959627 RepID=UPI00215897AB|nr:SprB repeat-containing protein [Marinoscillum sp. MHG1-6]